MAAQLRSCSGGARTFSGTTPSSAADHGRGPRLQVFVDERVAPSVREALDAGLPEQFDGWPVRYGWDAVSVHHVHVTTLRQWLLDTFGVDPRDRLSTLDWLVLPQQRPLGATRGAVFHHGLGELI